MRSQLRRPWRAEEPDSSEIVDLVRQINSVTERPSGVSGSLLQGDVVIAARAQNQIKIEGAEPFVHALYVAAGLLKEVEHVAAVNKDIAGRQIDAIVQIVSIADDCNAHA